MNSQSVGSVAIFTHLGRLDHLSHPFSFPFIFSDETKRKREIEKFFLFIFGVSIELLIKLTLSIEWVAQQCMSMSYRVAFDSIESPIPFVAFFTFFFVSSQN